MNRRTEPNQQPPPDPSGETFLPLDPPGAPSRNPAAGNGEHQPNPPQPEDSLNLAPEPEDQQEHEAYEDQTPDETLISQQYLCPYCGYIGFDHTRCPKCRGFFDPLSRQATQNHMGAWQLRAPRSPFQPAFSYDMLKSLVTRGKITRYSIVRGPTTRQFWSFACNTPGVAHLLGECHSCHAPVETNEYMCSSCNAILSPPIDRQHLGLAPIKLLPGQASPEQVAKSSMAPARRQTPGAAPPAGRASAPSVHPPQLDLAPAGSPQALPSGMVNQDNRETLRRLRDRVRFLTGAFVFTLFIIVALLILFAVLMLADTSSLRFGRPGAAKPTPAPASSAPATPSDAAPQTPAQTADSASPAQDPAQTAEDPAATPPSGLTVVLDPGLDQWAADIIQAAQLEKRDTVEALEEAAAILRRVKREAGAQAAAEGADTPPLPLLDARIDRLTERIDRLGLRDMFE